MSLPVTRPNRVACLAVALLSLLTVAACDESPTAPTGEVTIADLREGTGTPAASGRIITVHYTGWLRDTSRPDEKGSQFETSVGGAPYTFLLGFGRVIAGWDQGIPGMRVGGLRRLTIPPGLAYGSTGSGPIPPNATLIFEVELIAVQ